MRASIKLGRVWGIELGLHFSWILIAILITFSLAAQFGHTNPEWGTGVIWLSAIVTGVLFFAAIFAHELSHAFVAKLRGLPIHKITLFFLGGVAQIEREANDAKTEFWMGIAGPIMSVLVGLVCLGIAILGGWTMGAIPASPVLAVLVWLGYINLLLAAFNMIPGFPLDGGRVLRAIIWWVTKNEVRSTRIAARVGQVVAVVFITWGIWRFFTGAGLGGLWLAFIGWFLMQAASASYLQVQAASVLQDLRVGDVMSRDCVSVDGNSDLQTFVHQYLLRTGRRCFVVLEDGRMTGLVTPHEVKEVNPDLWRTTRIRDVMRPVDRVHVVSPSTPLFEALQLMGREDINQLPVLSNGRLEGILSRSHVLQVLQSRAELAA
ncbi:MAG: M50 family metallopeptidase [Terriglobales bacterium]